MRKMLFWGRMTPLEVYPVQEILLKNRINSNSGNLLFYSGVARTVMTGDVALEHFFVEDVDRLIARMDEVNAQYDCALIPLANAFRAEYAGILRTLTRFVRATKLPCYVIGVGVQARSEEELRGGFTFDADVRAFVSAVLDRSALLGLRGEYTAAYLQALGFSEERHFRVIGCPSAYLYGPECPQQRVLSFDALHRAAVSAAPNLPEQANALLRQGMAAFDEVTFISQRQREMWMLRYGYRFSRRSRAAAPGYYPLSRNHPLCRQGRALAFVSVREWIDFLSQNADFAFGSRIHGNLAAVLAGVPALLISCDLRTRELARYHGLPWVAGEALRGDEALHRLYDSADFDAFARCYPENFRRFVDFLNANEIPNIYAGAEIPLWGEAHFDRALAALPAQPIIRPDAPVPAWERLRALEGMYVQALRRRLRR